MNDKALWLSMLRTQVRLLPCVLSPLSPSSSPSAPCPLPPLASRLRRHLRSLNFACLHSIAPPPTPLIASLLTTNKVFFIALFTLALYLFSEAGRRWDKIIKALKKTLLVEC